MMKIMWKTWKSAGNKCSLSLHVFKTISLVFRVENEISRNQMQTSIKEII